MPWKYASKNTNKPTIRCEYCHKAYISKKRFKQHLMTKHVCPACPERFMGKKELSDHMKSHSRCEACNKWFNTYNNLFKHQAKTHHQCSKCLMFFMTFEESQDHPNCNANRPKYKCDQCDKEYLSKTSLCQHKKNIHCGITHECYICHNIYTSKSAYKQHINFHERKLPQCIVCKKYFNNNSTLSAHKKICNTYYCYRCHLEFTGKNNKKRYDKHMQDHKQEGKIKLVIKKKSQIQNNGTNTSIT